MRSRCITLPKEHSPPASRLRRPDPNDPTPAGISNRFIQGWKVPASRLVDFLGGEIQIPLTDKTGLDGVFDFKLEWAEEARSLGPDVLPDEDKPSLFAALQEQLGLKLEVHPCPVEMFVIDHVAKALRKLTLLLTGTSAECLLTLFVRRRFDPTAPCSLAESTLCPSSKRYTV